MLTCVGAALTDYGQNTKIRETLNNLILKVCIFPTR